MKIYEKIKEIRLEKSLNQKDVANILHVDDSAVSLIENGKRELRYSELEKIASLFGMPVVDIVTWPKKYVEREKQEEGSIETIIQLRLTDSLKKKVLQLVFGDNVEVLNI